MKQCIKCGNEIPEDAIRCRYCGAEQRQKQKAQAVAQPKASKKGNFCPKCGSPVVDPDATFCNMCGYKLKTKNPSQTSKKPQVSQTPQRLQEPQADYEVDETVYSDRKNVYDDDDLMETQEYVPTRREIEDQKRQAQNRENQSQSSGSKQPRYEKVETPRYQNQEHGAVKNAFDSEKEAYRNSQASRTNAENIANMKFVTGQESVLVGILASPIYLIFCILYTASIAFSVFTGFSIFNIIGQIIPILVCIGFWEMYCNKAEYERGSNIISKVIAVVFAIRIALYVIILVGLIVMNVNMWGYVFIIAVAAIDVGYWYSLHTTFSKLTKLGNGASMIVTAGIYPIIVLGIGAMQKVFSLMGAIGSRSAANGLYALVIEFFNEMGYYDYGYGDVSKYTDMLMSVIQSVLGLKQNLFGLAIAAAVPIFEIILMCKIRSSSKQVHE